MNFKAGNVYHIYNRGNDRQQIFFKHENYLYFLNKVRKYVYPHCHIMAYVLMPNHFHFLVYADERTEAIIEGKALSQSVLSNGFRLLLSSYTKGINRQEGRTGNLIQQNTRSKCVYDKEDVSGDSYVEKCFHYIHSNPVRTTLAVQFEDWEYSSYRDYAGLRSGTLCNKQLSLERFDVMACKDYFFSTEHLEQIF